MEDIKEILLQIQKEQTEQRKEMKALKENVEKINNTLEEKFTKIEQENVLLKEKIISQETQLEQMDRLSRRKNLIFFGVEENENNYHDLEKIIIQITNNIMQVSLSQTDIDSVRRIGRKAANTRPILVSLTTMGRKIEILRNKKNLENSNYYIKEDYSKKILEKRKELVKLAKIEEEKGNSVQIRYDKLIINNRNQKRSRSHSQSPKSHSAIICNDSTRTTSNHTNKKNKTIQSTHEQNNHQTRKHNKFMENRNITQYLTQLEPSTSKNNQIPEGLSQK